MLTTRHAVDFAYSRTGRLNPKTRPWEGRCR